MKNFFWLIAFGISVLGGQHKTQSLSVFLPIDVVAVTADCIITNVTITNESGCNDNGSADPSDDFFTADVVVDFENPPATGALAFDSGDYIFGVETTAVPVGNLNGNSHTFQSVKFIADGTPTVLEMDFTGVGGCGFLILDGPSVNSCSAGLSCSISSVTITNKSGCNDNGTSIATDDFYTANVNVTFSNPPATGDLRIEPGGDALPGGGATSVPVANLVGNSHTFTGVRFKADGNVTAVEMEFSADNACVRTANTTGVNSCSIACSITSVTFTNIGACDDNGTADPADDFYTADVNTTFVSPPATGDLRIEPGGDALPSGGATAVPVANLVGNSHTFTGVRFKADGNVTVVEMEFSTDNACVRTANTSGVSSCSIPPCTITIGTLQSSNVTCPGAGDGSIHVVANNNTGAVTFSITGPVNQSNGTGDFSGLPPGTYTLTVIDGGVPNCSATTTVTIATTPDLTPPTAICKSGVVLLNGDGIHTFTADEVFDGVQSGDNCGTPAVTSIIPSTVTCAQLNQTVAVDVTVSDGNGNSSHCTASMLVQEGNDLPAGWSSAKTADAGGTVDFSPCTTNGQFEITASGYLPGLTGEAIHEVFQNRCGNSSITAHITAVSGGGWAGITLRESLDAGSRMVALKTQLTNFVRREYRGVTNGPKVTQQFNTTPPAQWLRIQRTGNIFSFYTSVNGITWTLAGSVTQSMNDCLKVGLFVESINVNATTTALFDNVSLTGVIGPLAAAPQGGPAAVIHPPASKVGMFPNPTTGDITVDLSDWLGLEIQLAIYDVQGHCQQRFSIDRVAEYQQVIHLDGLANGAYLLKITSVGKEPASAVFVVDR